MKRWTMIAVGAVLALSACSGSSEQPSPAASSGTSPTAAASAAPTPGSSTPAAGQASASGQPCPKGQPAGTYRLEQFAGQGQSGIGVGKGGDATVDFTDGDYVLTSKGDKPFALTVAGKGQADLFVDGTVKGTYTTSGTTRHFKVGTAKGTAYLSNAAGERSAIDFAQVASVIGLNGDLAAACSGDRLALAGTAALFSLSKA